MRPAEHPFRSSRIAVALGFIVAVAFGLLGSPAARAETGALRDGDIVFQTSRSGQSLAIQRATKSPYSHMGLVLHRDGAPFVFEASATVRYTPLDVWIRRGEGERVVVKRLRDASALTPERIGRMRELAGTFEGRSYDAIFAWSDERLYCSELVWKLYERALGVRLGELERLGDFDLSDPVVRVKLTERYGRAVPLEEAVISPVAVFDSPLLESVELPGTRG